MPELPEVETIARDLREILEGASFKGISSEHLPSVLPGLASFEVVKGANVKSVERRGKFLLLFLDNDYVITMHLRMSGRILLRKHDEQPLAFERHRLNFDKSSLRFCDSRKFGRIWLSKIDDYEQMTGIWKLGIEPFDETFDVKKFKALMRAKRGAVKKLLLDQTLVTGIGNIYADESCFYAGVRPDAKAENLSERQLDRLFESVIKALKQGIENRGTSISDFQDAYGKLGSNQEVLFVYGRGGQKCMNCSSELIKTKVAGRGTVYCEKCQS